jgi:ankyrin repeat protein
LPPKPKAQRAPTLFDAIRAKDVTAFAKIDRAALKAKDEDGVSLLFYAVREGRTEIVEKLIAAGAEVNGALPPLLAAAMRNRPKEARLLIAAGADPRKARDKDGDDVVVTAAFRDNTAVLRVLLATKPSKDIVSLALLEAAGNGNLPIVKLLVKHGGDPAWRSKNGNTAMAIARAKKRSDVVAYFKGLAR